MAEGRDKPDGWNNGGSFILSGTGGVSNGTYYVLISSNLLCR
jgi:hypothetical protein